jgi:hypothetical protein
MWMPRHMKEGELVSEGPFQAIVCRYHLDPRLSLECLCDKVGLLLDDGHAEVGHDGDLGPYAGNDPLEVIKGEMVYLICGLYRFYPQHVDYEDVYGVEVGQVVEVSGIRDDPYAFVEIENDPICLDRMDGAGRYHKFNVLYPVRGLLFQELNAIKVGPDIVEDDRVIVQRVLRAEKNPLLLESALGHGLYHHVHVVGMVDMLMGENDAVEAPRFEMVPGGVHADKGPWSRVNIEVGIPVVYPQPACGPYLLGDDDACPAGPYEFDKAFHGAPVI